MNQNKKWILICSVGLLAIGVFLFAKGKYGDRSVEDTTHVVETSWQNEQSETPLGITEEAVMAEEEKTAAADSEKNEKGKNKKEEENETENEKKDKSSDPETSSHKADETDTGNDSENKTKKKETVSGKKNTSDKKQDSPAQTAAGQSAEPASQTAAPEPEEEKQSECTLTITCQQVFSHMDKLSESAKKVIPADGVILQGNYEIQQGDTVFDVLKRACAEKNVMLDYVYTPLYSTYYIRGIHNLYEFDCGDESGWMYSVNGTAPGYGCSQYKLSKGDDIIFYYTCER